MLKKSLIWVVGCLLILSSAAGLHAEPAKEVTVSAAISLKNAFEEVGALFESRNKGAKVVFNFGASGNLATQIEGGAPVDVFASAAQKEMNQLAAKKLIDDATRVDFARNTVVLIQPVDSKLAIGSFDDLLKPEIKMISIGNPETVPAGKYAQEVLTHLNLWEKIKGKLVLAENVRQVLDYVTKNEVDAGVVYATDAAVQAGKVKVAATAPAGSHKPVVYPVAVLKSAKDAAAGKAFIQTLTSEAGLELLRKYGFESAK